MRSLAAPPPTQVIPAGPTTTGSVLIVGSGFSGLGVAAKLDAAGITDWLILEHADTVGGTWRDNTYPGCACDIPSPLYSFSFDQNPNWSNLFAPQGEILQYLEDFSRRRGLRDRIRFGRHVTSATWDEVHQTWRVETSTGESYEFTHFVSAAGVLHRPKTPKLNGLDRFAGHVFHSARWDHEYDLTGKRVAVIGTGASAIQFVPAIVDQVSALTVFQRSAPWIMPKANHAFSPDERRKLRRFPWLKWYQRARLYWLHEQRAEQFTDVATDNHTTVGYARRHLAKQVTDPDLRATLTPDYALGCKRLLISNDWYPALTRPHVDVVTTGIREITPTTIVSEDGHAHDVDCIIFGTGFEAQDALGEITITGRDGRTLSETWDRGAGAYLGTTVHGFPNFFVMVGPNTGLGHNSQVFMIERQARYAVAAIKTARRRGAIEVKGSVQNRFQGWLRDRLGRTVWNAGGCSSWYINPKTGENTLLWPSTTIDFWKKTFRLRRRDYTFTRRR